MRLPGPQIGSDSLEEWATEFLIGGFSWVQAPDLDQSLDEDLVVERMPVAQRTCRVGRPLARDKHRPSGKTAPFQLTYDFKGQDRSEADAGQGEGPVETPVEIGDELGGDGRKIIPSTLPPGQDRGHDLDVFRRPCPIVEAAAPSIGVL